jgi:hypothetical protein
MALLKEKLYPVGWGSASDTGREKSTRKVAGKRYGRE